MMKKAMVAGISAAIVGLAIASLSCKSDDNGTNPPAECPDNLTAYQFVEPVAGAVLHVGQAYTVKWCYPTTSNQADVWFSNNAGDTYRDVLVSGGITKPTNSFAFTPLASDTGSQCVLYVGQYGSMGSTDVVSGTFSVVAH